MKSFSPRSLSPSSGCFFYWLWPNRQLQEECSSFQTYITEYFTSNFIPLSTAGGFNLSFKKSVSRDFTLGLSMNILNSNFDLNCKKNADIQLWQWTLDYEKSSTVSSAALKCIEWTIGVTKAEFLLSSSKLFLVHIWKKCVLRWQNECFRKWCLVALAGRDMSS